MVIRYIRAVIHILILAMGLTDRSGQIIVVFSTAAMERVADGHIVIRASECGCVMIETTMEDNGRTVKEVADEYFRAHPEMTPPKGPIDYLLVDRDNLSYGQ